MKRYPVLFLVFLLSTFTILAQTGDIIPDEGIVSPLHRSHAGQVTFMADTIPLAQYSEKDFLSSFTITEKCDLYIRVFLSHSLTNYLHELAPGLSIQQLNQHGNYQFSFFVDGALIYRENLQRGSGSPQSKNEKTIFRVPLLSIGNEDSWGRYMFRRFMLFGGEEALTPGKHLLRIEIKPYIDIPTLQTGAMIASGELQLQLKPRPDTIKVSEQQKAVQPIQPGSGWPLSSAGYDQNKIREMNAKIAAGVFKDITSIVVIRDGKLLLEEYFSGKGRDSLMDTRSVGKSFSSTLTGIAIRDGLLTNEHMQLGSFYDLKKFGHYSPRKDSVTLKSLLTMSSGFDGSDNDENSPGNEENMYPTANWVKFVLDLSMDTSKRIGEKWDYFTAGVVLLGDILDRRVPGGLEKYADAQLFGPLGIRHYQWQYTPQGVVNTAGGLKLRALDLARYGQLYKNGGKWDGKIILPETWVRSSFTRQLPLPGGPGMMWGADETYGYLFWNKTYRVGGKEYEAFYSSGNGGNKIFVFKDQPLVVVVTAIAYNRPYAHAQVDRIMKNYILPALFR